MANPRGLSRADIIRTASTFQWTKKMPKWRVVVNSRELPARPLVLHAAGVPPNDTTNSHQAVAILETLGFETRYVPASTTQRLPEADAKQLPASLEEVFSKISSGVPESSWLRVPTDLSKNLDHYLYGAKKLGK